MAKARTSKSTPTTTSHPTPPPPPEGRKVSVFDDPPRKNVLLLSCMDQRLLDDTVQFMNKLNLHNRYDQMALAGGAMGAHRLPDDELPYEQRWKAVFFSHLEAAIELLHRPIKDVFLFDHLDCGAYKELHPEDEIKEKYRKATLEQMTTLHLEELRAFAVVVSDYIEEKRKKAERAFKEAREACNKGATTESKKSEEESKCWKLVKESAEEKAKAWSDIRISYFLMDVLGKVHQLDVPPGERDAF